jgi:hypothetical protein
MKTRLTIHGSAYTDPAGTRRRIEALIAIGWSMSAIDAMLGWKVSRTSCLLSDPTNITRRNAARIAALYDKLWDKPAPARNRQERHSRSYALCLAKKRGYLKPLCWDDETIDDPNAVPYVEPEPPKKRGTKPRAVVEDIEWLASCSLSAPQIARRLGVSVYGLEQACRRADRTDLWLSLTAKQLRDAA